MRTPAIVMAMVLGACGSDPEPAPDADIAEPQVGDPCSSPSACGPALVCASRVCKDPSQVRTVYVSWTAFREPPTPSTCKPVVGIDLALEGSVVATPMCADGHRDLVNVPMTATTLYVRPGAVDLSTQYQGLPIAADGSVHFDTSQWSYDDPGF